MRMKVNVSAEHLAVVPRRKYIEHDLFTRALQRKGLGGVKVILIAGTEATIPDKAHRLRQRWEAGEHVEPFEFEIEWGVQNEQR